MSSVPHLDSEHNESDDPDSDARLSRLSRAIGELAGAQSVADVNTVVIAHAATALGAELASLSLLEDDGVTLRLIGISGAQASTQLRWARYPASMHLPAGEAVLTRAPVFVPGTAELERRYPALADAAPADRALWCLPLLNGERCLGAMSLSFGRTATPEARELEFLTTLGTACAHALERIRAQQDAAERAQKLEFLARASSELASSMDYRTTLANVARLAVPTLADWCGVSILEDGVLRSLAVAHVDPAKVTLAQDLERRYPPDPDALTGAPNVVRTGVSELYPEITDEMLVAAARDPEHLALCRELQLHSALIVPLISQTRVLGTLTMISAESGRRYGAEDLALAEDVGRRAAVAIDNAALHTETLESALRLQQALLPVIPTSLPGYEIAAEYRAAGHTDVGGDFYDAIVLPDGRVAVAVGDVMGRGVAAAAAMAQVRAALRAYVAIDPDPVVVMTHLDALFLDSDMLSPRQTPHLVTLVYLLADGNQIALANAGHPPPLLLGADGRTEFLPMPTSVPLGVQPEGRSARPLVLEEGATLLLYTDGLIERRREDIDVGLERLFACADHLRDPSLTTGVSEVVKAMYHAGRDDDVTVLGLRRIRAVSPPLA